MASMRNSDYLPAARLEELPPGTARIVQFDDRLVALFNIDGAVYATDNSCPHSGGPLGKGTLEGEIVTCPWHMWSFNVRTGECEINPEERIDTYPVLLRNGQILVKIPA
jgi:nitrite reductase/ring-hydroxylating ferredoxin subunit